MNHLAQKRTTNVVGFLAVIGLSAGSMLWLFWHHPVKTAIVTLVVLAAFGLSARLARLVDTDMPDMNRRNGAGLR
jgi:hypothetical protein